MSGTVRVLAAGVDSLYASVPDGLTIDGLAEAINHRAMAQDSADTAVWEIPGTGRTFLAMPHGFRNYVTCLRSPAMDLRIGPEDPHRPALMIEWRSPFLHRVGVEAAVEEGEQVAAFFCPQVGNAGQAPLERADRRDRIRSEGYPGRGLTVSRIDLYCDTQGWQPDVIPAEHFVARAVHRRRREEPARDVHRDGLAVSNISFGKGDLICRIYDKTRLMRKKGETWQREIWRGYDDELPVWRIEFQFRRSALRDFHVDGERVHSVADSLAVRQGLWEYAMDWLSLRDPVEDSNRSRWPVSSLWRELRAVEIGSPCAELVRDRVRDAEEARIVALFTGCASSLAARGYGRQLSDTVRRAIPAAERHLRKKGRSFEGIAAHKRERRLAL